MAPVPAPAFQGCSSKYEDRKRLEESEREWERRERHRERGNNEGGRERGWERESGKEIDVALRVVPKRGSIMIRNVSAAKCVYA